MNRLLQFLMISLLGIRCGLQTASLSSILSAEAEFNVLVFSKTAVFRHASIPTGIATIQTLGNAHNFTVQSSEDAALFNE